MASLIAWNDAGEIIATLDEVVVTDDAGNVLGVVDFEEQEARGAPLTEVWRVERRNPAGVFWTAPGSSTWPENLGAQAHSFRVELEPGWSRLTPRGQRPEHRVRALVHATSGHRRERADAIRTDPARPLALDEEGRTKPRPVRPDLPLRRGPGNEAGPDRP